MRKALGFFLGGTLFGSMTVLTTQVMAYQSHMHNALSSLQSAKQQLAVAQHDKAGHREQAQYLTQQAISETQAGIQAAAQ